MPELPEVETIKNTLEPLIKNKNVKVIKKYSEKNCEIFQFFISLKENFFDK